MGGKLKRLEQHIETVGANVVILQTPVIYDHACIGECMKQLALKTLLTDSAIER